MIDRCTLVRMLHYNPKTGIFTWRVRTSQRTPAGSVAGGPNDQGYIQIRIGGGRYKAHRLAWLYCYGYMPAEDIDHINGDTGDNRLRNLRLCPAGQADNQQNRRGPQQNNSTGWLGVDFMRHVSRKPYRARLKVHGRTVAVGRFDTAEEAGRACIRARRKLQRFNTL